jgi:hypothetical protein
MTASDASFLCKSESHRLAAPFCSEGPRDFSCYGHQTSPGVSASKPFIRRRAHKRAFPGTCHCQDSLKNNRIVLRLDYQTGSLNILRASNVHSLRLPAVEFATPLLFTRTLTSSSVIATSSQRVR